LAASSPFRIEGYVIVSSNGMIADANGVMPDLIRNQADQKYFQAGLDAAALLVHGAHSHEGGPRAARRRRLVVTRRVGAIALDPSYPHALLWNPAGATLEQAAAGLDLTKGCVAAIGGTEVFDLFLPRYDVFHLSRATRASIPGGRPVFAAVGPETSPEDVLTRAGLVPGPVRDLDPAAGVTLVTWQRYRSGK
jgi:dihydrofolate reductase